MVLFQVLKLTLVLKQATCKTLRFSGFCKLLVSSAVASDTQDIHDGLCGQSKSFHPLCCLVNGSIFIVAGGDRLRPTEAAFGETRRFSTTYELQPKTADGREQT
jgi:hypothetical protein